MENKLVEMIIRQQAELWIKENPLLLNKQEKQKFWVGLTEYLEDKGITIDDEVFDFLVQRKLVHNEPREVAFLKYLVDKYGCLSGKKVLDVGAGRVCALSKAIAGEGAKVTAIDTNIRIDGGILVGGLVPRPLLKTLKKGFKLPNALIFVL